MSSGIHHKQILKRATYKCTVITIISPLTEEDEVRLHARLSTQPSPRCLALSCLSIIWCCRPSSDVVALTYEHNRWCPPCLIVCIGYNAV